jgi:putative spermidine/putrescine transport system substrate-binding protein
MQPNKRVLVPTVNTNQIKDVTLRFIGTGVSQINEIAQQAQKDLGFKIQNRALSTDENNQIAITQPKSYDIFDGEYFSLPLVVPSGSLQPIDVKKLKLFDKLFPYFTTGKFADGAPVNTSQGTAPSKVMFLKGKDSTEFSPTPTDFATLIPFQYNADTLGYRPDLVGKPLNPGESCLIPNTKVKLQSLILLLSVLWMLQWWLKPLA